MSSASVIIPMQDINKFFNFNNTKLVFQFLLLNRVAMPVRENLLLLRFKAGFLAELAIKSILAS